MEVNHTESASLRHNPIKIKRATHCITGNSRSNGSPPQCTTPHTRDAASSLNHKKLFPYHPRFQIIQPDQRLPVCTDRFRRSFPLRAQVGVRHGPAQNIRLMSTHPLEQFPVDQGPFKRKRSLVIQQNKPSGNGCACDHLTLFVENKEYQPGWFEPYSTNNYFLCSRSICIRPLQRTNKTELYWTHT